MDKGGVGFIIAVGEKLSDGEGAVPAGGRNVGRKCSGHGFGGLCVML